MGPFRFGVSARILAGIALLATITVATSAIALTALLEFRQNFTYTAEERIPSMLLAARLREQSVGVLADVATLVLAEDQYQRALASSAIEARINSTWVLTAGLDETEVDDHWVGQLLAARERLSRDVRALDAVLEAQLKARTRQRQRLARLRQLEKDASEVERELVPLLDRERVASLSGWGEYSIITSLDGTQEFGMAYLREYVRPLQAWLTAFHNARMLLAETVALTEPQRIAQRAGRFRSTLGQLDRGLQTLPQELSRRLQPLLADLKTLGVASGDSLFALRSGELARDSKLNRLLVSSRMQADRLAGTVARLMDEISDRVRADAAKAARDINRLAVFALLACLLSVVAAGGVAWYVNGSLRKRLRRLQEALRASPADGHSRPADRRADEIGDIGRALGYFIDEIRRRERRLQELASTDDLTHVSNRRRFLEQAAQELSRARRGGGMLAVLMIDVDRFKAINDRYGHAAGDDTLRALAYTSKASLRQMDVFGRLGGEEFAILLPDTALDQAGEAAERLRQRLRRIAVPTGRGLLRFTVSIGVTVLDPADAGIDALLSRADCALYDAKRDGRNRVSLCPPEHGDPADSCRGTFAHGH